jgi:DamX protein
MASMKQADAQGTTPDWLALLGLEQDPFAAGHRPDFFYAEPAFLQRLDLLTHLAQFSDSLLVVLGETGAGKTTLLGELRARAGENWRVCELHGEEARSLEAVMLRLAGCLGLGALPEDSAELPQRVMDHCADLREVMELPVLIIDDAEQVPPSLLRTLAGLAGDPGATAQRLRIILFGAPPLEGLLAQAGLAPGLAPFVQTLNLPRLNEMQAAAYLMYRLTVAGYSGESPFSATEVRAIAKASGGLPGVINALAREALQAHVGQASVIMSPGRGLRLLPIALVGVLLVAAAAYWWAGNRTEPGRTPELLAERPLPLPPPATGLIVPRDLPEAEVETLITDLEQALEEAEAPQAQAPEPAPEVAETPEAPEAETTPDAQEAAEPVSPQVPELAQALPEAAPVPDAQPAPEEEETAAGTLEAGAEAALEPAPPPPPPPAVAQQRTPAPVATRVHGADWVRAQPGGRYTLQLLVSSSEEAVKAFIDRHGLKGDLAYFYRRQGGEGYILLYGSYPNTATAKAAIRGLPARVQRDKPWPRSFASVQAQLADQ